MANNYTGMSFEIHTTPEEKEWLERAAVDPASVGYAPEDKDYWPPCGMDIEPSGVWFYMDEGVNSNIDDLLELLCAFQRAFPPGATPIIVEWASWCSKPRLHEFGGGVAAVRFGRCKWINTGIEGEKLAGLMLSEQ